MNSALLRLWPYRSELHFARVDRARALELLDTLPIKIGDTAQRGRAGTEHSLSSIRWRRGPGEEVWLRYSDMAPLLGPLPTPPSWGEEEESAPLKICTACDNFRRYW